MGLELGEPRFSCAFFHSVGDCGPVTLSQPNLPHTIVVSVKWARENNAASPKKARENDPELRRKAGCK